MTIRVYNIVWDTDGANIRLPHSVTIANWIFDAHRPDIVEFLTLHFGWDVVSYKYSVSYPEIIGAEYPA